MIKCFINWLKWNIAYDEMAELEKRRIIYTVYIRWMAEFPNIAKTIEAMESEATSSIVDNGNIYAFRETIRKSNTK